MDFYQWKLPKVLWKYLKIWYRSCNQLNFKYRLRKCSVFCSQVSPISVKYTDHFYSISNIYLKNYSNVLMNTWVFNVFMSSASYRFLCHLFSLFHFHRCVSFQGPFQSSNVLFSTGKNIIDFILSLLPKFWVAPSHIKYHLKYHISDSDPILLIVCIYQPQKLSVSFLCAWKFWLYCFFYT